MGYEQRHLLTRIGETGEDKTEYRVPFEVSSDGVVRVHPVCGDNLSQATEYKIDWRMKDIQVLFEYMDEISSTKSNTGRSQGLG